MCLHIGVLAVNPLLDLCPRLPTLVQAYQVLPTLAHPHQLLPTLTQTCSIWLAFLVFIYSANSRPRSLTCLAFLYLLSFINGTTLFIYLRYVHICTYKPAPILSFLDPLLGGCYVADTTVNIYQFWIPC